MKLFVFIIIISTGFVSTKAQSLQEFFVNTPDSLLPYVVKLDREALLAGYDATKDTCSTMDLSFGGKLALTRIKADEIDVSPSKAMSIQYGMLPAEGDSVVCVITTYKGLAAESNIKLYNRQWQFIRDVEINGRAQLVRPDTMSVEKFDEIKKLQEIVMIEAEFSKNSPKSIILQYSMPMMSDDEKNAFKSLIMQTTLNWNGKTFN